MKRTLIAGFLMVAAAVAAFAAVMDRVVVKVNDAIILESEIDETVDLMATQMKLAGKPADKAELKKKIMDNLVEQKLIITMAADEQVAVSDEAVADKVNEFIDSLRQRFSNEEDFEAALEKEGMSYSDFRMKIEAQVKDSLIFSKVKQKKQQEFIAKAAVSDDEIKSFYEKNKNDFKVNDEVNISQIFLSKAEADAAKAGEVAAKLKNGADFNTVLADAKKAWPATGGGELGWVDTTQMDKKIKEALKSPKKGKIVGPVETEEGFHVIKIVDYKKGDVQDLSGIKEKVRVKIIESKIETMWDEWIQKVKKQAYIKYM